jgi:adenosylmethionine---8-amino-7-oxononanoate aminotransferase
VSHWGALARVCPKMQPKHWAACDRPAIVADPSISQCRPPATGRLEDRPSPRSVLAGHTGHMSSVQAPPNSPSHDASEMLAIDARRVWHPYDAIPSRNRVHPVVSAEGVRIRLADGRILIDGMSSWWAAIHGYNHPALNRAVSDQLGSMAHVMLGGLTHPPVIELAERLVSLTPPPLESVFFSDSGSVAVEVAIKMALQYWMGVGRPKKVRLLTARGGYHGDTFAAMSVCDPDTGMHHLFDGVLSQQLFVERPSPRFGETLRPEHVSELETAIADHAEELAAVIIEPVAQGAGGMYFYSPEYLVRLRALCDANEVLLIADEIATGFGRTGEMFGVEHAGISPDIACLGKAMTGGYLSMAATLCTDEVSQGVCAAEPRALMHGPTFMGNPLAASVANASIGLLTSQPWQANVRRIERHLQEGLAPAANLPGVADVRVLGAIGVLEMAEPVPMDATQAVVMEHGVWLRPFGRLLYTMPPYVIGEEDLVTITGAMLAAAEAMALRRNN